MTTMTKEPQVTTATRRPTTRQEAVLGALLQLDAESPETDVQLHPTPRIVQCIRENIDAGADPAKILEALQQVRRHEWIDCVQQGSPKDGDAPGAHLQWIIGAGGVLAFERGAADKEPAPEDAPPWGDTRPPAKGDEPEEETVLEGALPEPVDEGSEEPVRGKENKVVGSQLTMKVGGPKPIASVLKIGAKQVQYAHKQFDQLQQIPFSGMLEIREVGSKVADNGKAVRVHVAKVVSLDVDGENVVVETEEDA